MTHCPRCSASNEDTRVSCWNCFAPIQGPLAAKVKPMILSSNVSNVPMEPLVEVPVAEEAAPKKRGMFSRKK